MADKVLCRTPTPGKKGTRIDRWKFDLLRKAILRVVPADEMGVRFSGLPELVERELSTTEQEELGSISWYTTTVKLELEVRGEIERVADAHPQRVRRGR
jgi:hypothetical protein